MVIYYNYKKNIYVLIGLFVYFFLYKKYHRWFFFVYLFVLITYY